MYRSRSAFDVRVLLDSMRAVLTTKGFAPTRGVIYNLNIFVTSLNVTSISHARVNHAVFT